MKLQLKYKNNKVALTKAAFVQGTNPAEWLSVLDTFGIELSELECYLAPKSKANVEGNGIFVIFPLGKKTKELNILFPYQKINNNLFIPLQSELYPEVSQEEWRNILFYDRSFFHPNLGLIGFNLSDAINWKELIILPEISNKKWSFAQEGNEPYPKLNQVNLILPPEDDIVKNLEKGLDKKSLKDIPKNDKEKKEGFFSKLGRKSLEKGLEAADNFRDKFGSDNNDYNKTVDGMLSKFENWMSDNLENLQQKREDEIDRLLDLFDKNPSEALKYALPLAGKYFGRGTSNPTGRLGRRNTNFSLGGLGGGSRSDSWDIGNRYHSLMAKYRRTAEQLTRDKKYKDAAYIYASLLADYSAAANVLKQGKYYHDAAALYKVHLKNKNAAAECYEEGGLYLEAIELYKEILGKEEKLGDLYREIKQDKNAEHFYRKAVDSKKDKKQFLLAGDILVGKLFEKESAKKLYLNGWKTEIEKEDCLRRYFQMTDSDLSSEIKYVYEAHTAEHQQMNLLDILIEIQNNGNEEVLKTSKEIAYEIVSRESKKGNNKGLYKLRSFLKEDQLISSDISRYITEKKKVKIEPARNNFDKIKTYSLGYNEEMKWIGARLLSGQLIIFGKKKNILYLSRWDLNENKTWTVLEEGTWIEELLIHDNPLYIADSPDVVERLFFTFNYGKKCESEFSKNAYFSDNLKIVNPSWLPENMLGIYSNNSAVHILVEQEYKVFLKIYNVQGELLSTVNCTTSEGEFLVASSRLKLSKMVYRKGYFYIAMNNFLWKITPSGKSIQIELPVTTIEKMIVTDSAVKTMNLIATDKGCLLLKPNENGMDVYGSFFATDFIVQSMCFLKDHLLIASKFKVSLYKISTEKDTSPELLSDMTSTDAITSVHRGSKRNECIVLTTTGKITTYALDIH